MQINAAMQAALNKGAWEHAHLMWIVPKERSTGTIQPYGFWTGLGTLNITLNSENRQYFGAGELIDVPNFTYEMGLDVKVETLTMSVLSPDVTNAIRAYDVKLAPVQVHLVMFDSQTKAILGVSEVYQGQVDDVQITNDTYCDLSIAQSIRAGTRPLTLMKTHESQKLRNPNDNGFKYAAIAATAKVPNWGDDITGGWKNSNFRT